MEKLCICINIRVVFQLISTSFDIECIGIVIFSKICLILWNGGRTLYFVKNSILILNKFAFTSKYSLIEVLLDFLFFLYKNLFPPKHLHYKIVLKILFVKRDLKKKLNLDVVYKTSARTFQLTDLRQDKK